MPRFLTKAGLYFKCAMAEMEEKDLFSFHASALHREEDNRLLLLVGRAALDRFG